MKDRVMQEAERGKDGGEDKMDVGGGGERKGVG